MFDDGSRVVPGSGLAGAEVANGSACGMYGSSVREGVVVGAVVVAGKPSAAKACGLAAGSLMPRASSIAPTRLTVHTEARDLPRWNHPNNSCGRSPSNTSIPVGMNRLGALFKVTTAPPNGTTTTRADTNCSVRVTDAVIDFSENIAERA